MATLRGEEDPDIVLITLNSFQNRDVVTSYPLVGKSHSVWVILFRKRLSPGIA